MGAGGIGFDVAELITHAGPPGATDIDVFAREWGIDFANHPRGGVTGVVPQVASSGRSVTLLQRKTDPVGKTLGRTTGWTHRMTLARRGVRLVNGVEYLKVDDAGLHVRVFGEPQLLEVDTVIVCAGQLPLRDLYDELRARHPFTLPPELLRVAINTEFGDWAQPLADGDAVVFIPPVAGG